MKDSNKFRFSLEEFNKNSKRFVLPNDDLDLLLAMSCYFRRDDFDLEWIEVSIDGLGVATYAISESD